MENRPTVPNGPRRYLVLKDQDGTPTVTLSMAYGLSVKWAVAANGDMTVFIDREGEQEAEMLSRERVSTLAPQTLGPSVAPGGSTSTSPRPKTTSSAVRIEPAPQQGRRGRPRINPIPPRAPGKLGDFKEGLDMRVVPV